MNHMNRAPREDRVFAGQQHAQATVNMSVLMSHGQGAGQVPAGATE
jgi:hypothetical protein